MSFKREGDDLNLLQNLNHQRVKELLSNHIPEDEAKLLSNGRLACMICLNRPIFDTINMLSIHRKGKKHLHELSKHIQCQERSVVKGLRRSFPLTGMISNPPDVALGLLGSKHIRCARHRRKTILEITPIAKVVNNDEVDSSKSASATVRRYIKSLTRKSSLDQVVEKSRENYGEGLKLRSPAAAEPAPSADRQAAPPLSPSKDHDLKLRMSGWIKDSLGKWIKDPNVEFDSDEDETPVAPI